MVTEKTKPREINEHIIEIRYKPNPKILDYRGTWAEMVSAHMELPEWRIVENRFDVFDKDYLRRAFISFRNAGLVVHNSPTKNYFSDQGNKLLKFLFDQEPFGDPLYVERLGIRSRFAITFSGSFSDLLNRYMNRVLTISESSLKIFNAKVTDIGGPIYFKTSRGNINSVSGPMIEDQIREFFPFSQEIPKVALHIDLDYWINPQKKVDSKKILNLLKEFSDENWNIHEQLINIVIDSY